MLSCQHAGECSGCPFILAPYEEQKTEKLDRLRSVLDQAGVTYPSIEFLKIDEGGLRDRIDFTYDGRGSSHGEGPLRGLFHLERREIVDMKECPQMSKNLGAWFQEFREIRFPIAWGSVRLRVGPGVEAFPRGAWLDFSNVDIKSVLDDGRALEQLTQVAHVEMGQRRKVVVKVRDEHGYRFKLSDPVAKPWFETYIGQDLKPVPLSLSLGDFTQPSMRANKVLVSSLMDLVRQSGVQRVSEFGSGIGNFTLPLCHELEAVDCYEVDKRATQNLRLNLENAGLISKAKIFGGDYQNLKNDRRPDFSGVEALVVDPPRSGLKGFLNPLDEMAPPDRPKFIFYVSCFAQSFSEDVFRLQGLGYQLKSLSLVDQFPQSPHFEMVSLLEL